MNHYNHANVKHAKQLRKEMTPWESKLWYCYLNKHAVRFYRQKPIGKYIADFYCPKVSLIIELDGGGHYDPNSQQKDHERTMELEKLGLKVIRFCNMDIDRNFRGVCESIDIEVSSRRTLPQSR
jgi:very-short-patch-repair endonuclease